MIITFGDKVLFVSDSELPIKIETENTSTTIGEVVLNNNEYTLYASKQGKLVTNKKDR